MTAPRTPAPQNHPAETGVGSVFVSNYPPYGAWKQEMAPEAEKALQAPPAADATLGLYLHIPFCRLRCKFCYFKVYTDKDGGQVAEYLEALAREVELYSALPAVAGRPLKFIYFGGGTPSFISSRQLRTLAERLRAAMTWSGVEEISFECEPGTLTRSKLETIRDLGVTRLSLGVEHFDDAILKENGRAHLSAEIDRCMPWIDDLGFDQLNIDLIAGMVGETWETWRDAVARTIALDPDSVTIYQMELPFNTVYSRDLLGGAMRQPAAGWDLKRAWHDYAIDAMSAAGYEISSAYTMVKKGTQRPFVYRDAVWHGTDMIGAGVAAFSHMTGVHFQNVSEWGPYLEGMRGGRLPIDRAFRTSRDEQLVRELILQLKLGRISGDYFRNKFEVDIFETFRQAFDRLEKRRMLHRSRGAVELSRTGLLQVDSLLPEFFDSQYRNARYT
jgi:oxygen-independent coproporphyrinogen-3 oxidase